jgi:hypothetical protein
MTAAACFVIGWPALSFVVGLLLGAAIRRADHIEQPEQLPPIIDPETSLLWTENGRVDTWA